MDSTYRLVTDLKGTGHVKTIVTKMESVGADQALPSPTDTPYRTPSSSQSRVTSNGYDDPSPQTTPPNQYQNSGQEMSYSRRNGDDSMLNVDDELPLSDPRRFTPTLHASLISEILSLRRDLESRTNDIDRLEQNLHHAQVNNDNLNSQLLASKADVRHLKRQMQFMEGGTLSALNELAVERDAAVKKAAEARSLLKTSQDKAKYYETRVDEVQEQWQKDKTGWQAEKRALDTKVHIAEGRLRVVVSEFEKSLSQASDMVVVPPRASSRQSLSDSPLKQRPLSHGARRQSLASNASEPLNGRTSAMSFNQGHGLNLAEELGLDNISEDARSPAETRVASPDHDENVRPVSGLSLRSRKPLGLALDLGAFDSSDTNRYSPRLMGDFRNLFALSDIPTYVDSGIQYSRPPSPKHQFSRSPTPTTSDRQSKVFSPPPRPASVAYTNETSDNAWEETLHNRIVMVSSACQTVDLITEQVAGSNGPLLDAITEVPEFRDSAVQTDDVVERVFHHTRTDTNQTASTDLLVPSITIVPPTSRPVTPDKSGVKLPPRTKSVLCQVETHVLVKSHSIGVQTQDVRADSRIAVPPRPVAVPPLIPARAHALNNSRRKKSSIDLTPSRRSPSPQALPPINDDGPLSDNGAPDVQRPIRSSSMFAGFEDLGDDHVEDDVFRDEDFFSGPTTKFVLSAGKLISSPKEPAFDPDELEAVAAGKRMALSNIRMSEDGLPPSLKQLIRDEARAEEERKARSKKASSKQIKRVPSAKTSSIRRAAMVQNGAVAQRRKNSMSSLNSTDVARPPVAIPIRYSSARVGKTGSESGRTSRGSSHASPTRTSRRAGKQSTRKSRSAASPSGRTGTSRARSRTPPVDSRVSIVPEMPQFYMPEAEEPKSRIPSGYAASFEPAPARSVIVTSQNPDAPKTSEPEPPLEIQQTTVVDAIAQTMIGEWMFKYVRPRKSFGKPDKDWDPSKSVEEMTNSTAGIRHKRWVWLAPYEKSVMWSSKQPMDGTALLGKNGRKLQIRSVLDIKDDNVMPKGVTDGQHFTRSILILTPQRALKFTAATQERHYVWLTALSFLSHSPISLNDLAPPPQLPPKDRESATPSPNGVVTTRRKALRDSIRMARATAPQPGQTTFRSFTGEGIAALPDFGLKAIEEQYDPLNDAALPPTIRRFHTRQRSYTTPKPPGPIRAFLTGSAAPAVPLVQAQVQDHHHLSNSAAVAPSPMPPSGRTSRRASEASATIRPYIPASHFLEATGNSSHAASITMRMDAFMGDRHPPLPRGPMRNLRVAHSNLARGVSSRNLREMNSWAEDDHERARAGAASAMSAPAGTPSALGSPLVTPTENRFSSSALGHRSTNEDFR